MTDQADTRDIAADVAFLLREGRDDEAGRKYWAEDLKSIEARRDWPVSVGPEAARAKGEWFMANHEVHDVKVEGPWVNGDQFTLRITYDLTPLETGVRTTFEEIALYTVRDGQIVEEKFFYDA